MTLSHYIIKTAEDWFDSGRQVVVATIARVRGSSSQPLASRMAISDRGAFVGFVSGGCVEADVCEQAQAVIQDQSPRIVGYGPVKDSLFEIGLNCEGQIDVLLEPLTRPLLDMLIAAPPSEIVTRYQQSDGGRADVEHFTSDTLGKSREVPSDVESSLALCSQDGATRALDSSDGWQYLLEPVRAPETLLIVSASSVAYPLCRLGKALGFRVVVSDPRTDYAKADRFPDADEVLAVWPRDLPNHLDIGPDCLVVSLNHEPRFEDDLFRMLQSQPRVGYIGAIGKRQRHVERIERQKESNFDLSMLPPIHTPVGLDLGGKQPEEIALSILAEIQALRHKRGGSPLRHATDTFFLDGPICDQVIRQMVATRDRGDVTGAQSVFIGRVRADEHGVNRVVAIEYEAYDKMAGPAVQTILDETKEQLSLIDLRARHSLGRVDTGSCCILVVAAARHRESAMQACRIAVDRIKSEVPIFAKELLGDGTFAWKQNRS